MAALIVCSIVPQGQGDAKNSLPERAYLAAFWACLASAGMNNHTSPESNFKEDYIWVCGCWNIQRVREYLRTHGVCRCGHGNFLFPCHGYGNNDSPSMESPCFKKRALLRSPSAPAWSPVRALAPRPTGLTAELGILGNNQECTADWERFFESADFCFRAIPALTRESRKSASNTTGASCNFPSSIFTLFHKKFTARLRVTLAAYCAIFWSPTLMLTLQCLQTTDCAEGATSCALPQLGQEMLLCPGLRLKIPIGCFRLWHGPPVLRGHPASPNTPTATHPGHCFPLPHRNRHRTGHPTRSLAEPRRDRRTNPSHGLPLPFNGSNSFILFTSAYRKIGSGNRAPWKAAATT